MRQEVTEFRRLVGGQDPATGRPFGSDLRAIADTYLLRNEPQVGEIVLVFVDGVFYRGTDDPRLTWPATLRWRSSGPR